MATFDLNDDSVVVIIGTGAGGGVLANELAQKGVKVVALEAGGRYLPEDYVNDEWESFGQLAWLDARTTSGDSTTPRKIFAPPLSPTTPLTPSVRRSAQDSPRTSQDNTPQCHNKAASAE